MKKFLLGTTALVGLAAVSSGAMAGGAHNAASASDVTANPGGLTVMVGGFIDVQHAVIDQEEAAGIISSSTGASAAASVGNTKDAAFTNDAEIHITVAGSTEDFDYGGVVELQSAVSNDFEGEGTDADKVYIFVEGDEFGRVELGSNSGASQTLEIDASNIARATGGIEGDWWHYVDFDGIGAGTTNSTSGHFKIEPNLVVADGDATTEDANKITYYTPRIAGFQAGVSYTPDTGDVGTAASITADNNGDFENVWVGGVNYEIEAEGVGVALAAVGEFGESEANNTEDLTAYSFGGKVEFEGFSLAGNWADLGDSGLSTTATEDEQSYWTVGGAFENGPYGISATYIQSEQVGAAGATGDTDELSNIVVGADYQLAPGLTPYVEAAFFEFDEDSVSTDNEGSVVILGAELSF